MLNIIYYSIHYISYYYRNFAAVKPLACFNNFPISIKWKASLLVLESFWREATSSCDKSRLALKMQRFSSHFRHLTNISNSDRMQKMVMFYVLPFPMVTLELDQRHGDLCRLQS